MNSQEFINSVAKKSGLEREQAVQGVNALKDVIIHNASGGRPVYVPNFGTFETIVYEGKVSQNIQNPNHPVILPPLILPVFKPDSTAQEKIKSTIPDDAKKSTDLIQSVSIPYLDLSKITVPKNVLAYIPEHIARRYQVVPIEEKDDKLIIGMIDPEDQETIELVKKRINMPVELILCTQDDLNHILDQYSALQSEVEAIVEETELEPVETTEETPVKTEEISEHAPAAKIVASLFKRAVREKASDIHIEPMEDEIIVRFRIDGVLRKIVTLPKNLHPAIISRIKILSNLKIDETRLPQDGRFQIHQNQSKIDFRISTLPTVNGEKVVARILDKSAGVISLEALGVRGHAFEVVKENITKSHGMLLVTGPTGSGKTTTLYAVLDRVRDITVNIVTLEDPVEYRMPGVNQSQVNNEINFTFSNGLRSILRQDPNIVMVGEIRDFDTANIAVHAALTGHVVLSTLHTNDAAGAIPRLVDMDIEPFLLTASLNAVVAQRLCRKVCPDCRVPAELSNEELAPVFEEIKQMPGDSAKNLGHPTFYKGKGCPTCNNSGYSGRIGIFEVFGVSEKIKTLIAKNSTADILKQTAIEEGMISMKQDGILKSAEGLTSLEEVWRVTKD